MIESVLITGANGGLVINAGGIVGKDFAEKTADGVTQMLAVNLLGHVVLLPTDLQMQSSILRVPYGPERN